jgi:integrase
MGAIRKRGGTYHIRYFRNGRRYEESAHTGNWEKANRLLKLREGAAAQGQPVTPQIGRLTFDDAADEFERDYRVNKRRSGDYAERRLKLHLRPHFTGYRMATMTTADVTTYTDKRQQGGASNATINRELAILKRMFTLAIRGGQLLSRPHIPMLAENNVRQGFVSPAQMDAICEHLPVALRGVVQFCFLTGWRMQSEVLPMTWGQVDRTAGVVRLEPGQTKSGRGRTFTYRSLPELKAVIDSQWGERERLIKAGKLCPYVFHRNGKPIKNLRTAWAEGCRAAGFPGRLPHDLRRSAVRSFVRAGIPDSIAMKMSGHQTRSVFDRYDITSEADLNDAGAKLHEHLTGAKRGAKAETGQNTTADAPSSVERQAS